MKDDIIICSTDTDLFAIALINYNQLKLGERNIVIHFGKAGQEFVYCCINNLWNLSAFSKHTVYWQHKTLTCWRSLVWCTLLRDATYYHFFVVSLKAIASRCSTSTPISSALNDAEKIVKDKQPELNVFIIALLQFWIRYYQKKKFLILCQVAGVTKFFSKWIIYLYCRKSSLCFELNEMPNLCTKSNCDTVSDTIQEKKKVA